MSNATPTLRRKPRPIAPGAGEKFRLCVYGEPGVGKTTLLLSFPAPLVVDTDGGLEGDAVVQLSDPAHEWNPEVFKDLNDLYFWIKGQAGKHAYQTLGFDSFDTLYRFLLTERVKLRTKGENLTDLQQASPQQNDYQAVTRALDHFLQEVRSLGLHVVLTSDVLPVDLEAGRTKRRPAIAPATYGIVRQWSNVLGELVVARQKDGEERRVLVTDPADRGRDGKARWAALRPGIINPSFELFSKATTKPEEPES